MRADDIEAIFVDGALAASAPFPVAAELVVESDPAVVFDGDEYLIVWSHADEEIRASWIAPGGTPTPALVVSAEPGAERHPAVAVAQGRGQALVIYDRVDPLVGDGTLARVRARTLTAVGLATRQACLLDSQCAAGHCALGVCCDTDCPPDAGVTDAADVPVDAAAPLDAGAVTLPDAAPTPPDAAPTLPPDALAVADATVDAMPPDGAADATVDATPPDGAADATVDAMPPDGAADAASGDASALSPDASTASGPSGCSCSTQPRSSPDLAGLLVWFSAWLFARRRRRR
jgi:uncharacterized protein (TIGR03382 family)